MYLLLLNHSPCITCTSMIFMTLQILLSLICHGKCQSFAMVNVTANTKERNCEGCSTNSVLVNIPGIHVRHQLWLKYGDLGVFCSARWLLCLGGSLKHGLERNDFTLVLREQFCQLRSTSLGVTCIVLLLREEVVTGAFSSQPTFPCFVCLCSRGKLASTVHLFEYLTATTSFWSHYQQWINLGQ